ncbi:MAG: hypothetical protein RLZ63_1004 [Pseudomonadota bacterium]|jgi:hypothetical protein
MTMGEVVNLLRYPDGERRELRRWGALALGVGLLLGGLGMQILTWQVEARVQLNAVEQKREQARLSALAEQARQAKVQQALHERRLQWQKQVSKMLDQHAQAARLWQLLSQSGAQQGLTFGRLQWSGERWTLQGQAPDMAAVIRMRDALWAEQGVRGELKTWAAAASTGSGSFQLEWVWPSPNAKP